MSRKSPVKVVLIVIVCLLVICGIAGTYYFYNKYQQLKADPVVAAKEINREILENVGKLTVLPSDEEPTFATVSDKDKLTSQIFFKDAENQDKLIVYVTTKKAILYRPSTNKIINIAPIYINTEQTTSTSTTN